MLREYRKSKKWTLEIAAEKFGMSISYLSELETGVSAMTLPAARKIEAATRGKLRAAALLGLGEKA